MVDYALDLYARDTFEPFEKIIHRCAAFKILKQRRHRHPRAFEKPGSADLSRNALDRRTVAPIQHKPTLHPFSQESNDGNGNQIVLDGPSTCRLIYLNFNIHLVPEADSCELNGRFGRAGRLMARVSNPMSNDSDELAFVALGSNLGDSADLVDRAMEKLQALSAGPLLRSSLWQSVPVDCPPGSPPFVNAVAGIAPRPGETPATLLARLQELESAFGRRRRKIPNEPRLLDLDLIAFGSRVIHEPGLELPHPRAHLRGFVLRPLAEIAPDFVLPKQSLSVRELLGRLPPDTNPAGASTRRLSRAVAAGKLPRK